MGTTPIAVETLGRGLSAALNGPWHRRALFLFLFIVLAHWMEHVLQAFQIWVLDWERPLARGGLGYLWPWLVSSEWLHWIYNLALIAGLAVLAPAFVGRARNWWMVALWIEIWHFFEHGLLLGQALSGYNLFGKPVPTSVLQLGFQRAEVHLFYNLIVLVPLLIGAYRHFWPSPPDKEAKESWCSCATKIGEPAPAVA